MGVVLTSAMEETSELRKLLSELADDPTGQDAREEMCTTVGAALARLGKMLWVLGSMLGPDRALKRSPFQFGDDRAVGVATVAQIGGELTISANHLLGVGHRYAASALIRQLVEVEYLATAFAADHEIAAEWLRADRDERLNFWSPARLRDRAGGRFLRSDYSNHCELGGHPTTRGMSLLPDHEDALHPALLWVDMAGHLFGVWRALIQWTERYLDGPVPKDWEVPDADSSVKNWLEEDKLYGALQYIGHFFGGNAPSGAD